MPNWKPLNSELSTHLPFTPAVEANGFIFVSGQASVDETGKIVSGTFDEEVRRSFENVRRVLSDVGCDLTDVCKVTSYVTDHENVARYNELYREFFSDPLPARTTLSGCLSPRLKFEVDVVAVRPD